MNFKDIKRGQILENIEGDIAFDKPDFSAPVMFDEEEQHFSENELIQIKHVQ